MLDWQPHSCIGRDRGRPETRWTDQIEKFAGGDGRNVASNADPWKFYEEGFATLDD